MFGKTSMRRDLNRSFLSLLFSLAVGASWTQQVEPSTATALGAEPQEFFNRRTLLAVTNPDYLVSPGDVYTLIYNREQLGITQYLIVEPTYLIFFHA